MATRGRPRRVQEEVSAPDIAEDISQAVEKEQIPVEVESPVSDEIVYETAQEETASFDILLAGEYIKANWNSERTKFHFNVPARLAPRMEVHYHFITQRIIRRD